MPGRDDAEILALRSRVWGPDHPYNNPAYFEWLFRANPAGPGTGSVLRRGDSVIGFCGISARRMRIDGRNALVAHCVDYMVDPAARGGMAGLYGFRLMQKWLKIAPERGFSYGIGFPNVNSARLAMSPKLGWRTTFNTTLLVRPYARLSLPAKPVGGMPPPVAAAGLGALAGWSTLSRLLRAKAAPGRAASFTTFDQRFDDLSAALDATPVSGTRSDAAYLNWRFAQHPLNHYDIVGWENEGALQGYAATVQRDVFGFKATLLVDLAAAKAAPAIEFALLAETLRRSRDAGASMVASLAVEGTSRYRNLIRFGFVPVPARLDPKPFLMAAHGFSDPTAADRIAASEWRFNWADMDIV